MNPNSDQRKRLSRKQNKQTETCASIRCWAALTAALPLLLVVGVSAFGAAADASYPVLRHASRRVARTLSVTDTGHLHRVQTGGEYIAEEGQATGTIPGKVRA